MAGDKAIDSRLIVPAPRSRLPRVRLLLPLLLALAGFLPVAVTHAAGAESSLPTATSLSLGSWVVNAAAVLAIAYMILKFILAFRRHPPLEKEFAPYNHEHSGYVTPIDIERTLKRCEAERRDIAARASANDRELFGKLDNVRSLIADGFRELDTKAENRSVKLHNRINPMGEEIRSNSQQIQNHLSDHRKGGLT